MTFALRAQVALRQRLEDENRNENRDGINGKV